MSKIRQLFFLFIAAAMLSALFGCANTDPTIDDGTSTPAATTVAPPEVTEAPSTTASPETTKAPDTTASPETTKAPDTTTAPETTAPSSDVGLVPGTTPKSLKILAIGNSFSTDAMQYLVQIAKNLGVETVVLGNLYIGGCSVDTHYSHARAGDGAYTYYKTTNGSWSSVKGVTMLHGIKDEAWDIITIQQTSKTCGLPQSYRNLAPLVAFVEENKPASAGIAWHMTWAYQQDSTHSSFPNYNRDQMTMYNMIISTTAECVDTIPAFSTVIPVGTAVQNARTGFIGDTLTRDGYHMSYDIGRMLAGMTWFASITGCSVEELTYNPAPSVITEDVMKLLKESVANAIASPRAVTESKHKTGNSGSSGTVVPGDVVLEPADFLEADIALAAASGIDLSKYTLFEWDHAENAYWYCTKHADLVHPSSGSSTYNQNVCTATLISRDQLPVGTVIICDPGWQYRPEKWLQSKAPAKTRPSLSSTPLTVMDEAWWGDNAWCAFNIASLPKSNISANFASAAAHLRFYVPNVSQ